MLHEDPENQETFRLSPFSLEKGAALPKTVGAVTARTALARGGRTLQGALQMAAPPLAGRNSTGTGLFRESFTSADGSQVLIGNAERVTLLRRLPQSHRAGARALRALDELAALGLDRAPLRPINKPDTTAKELYAILLDFNQPLHGRLSPFPLALTVPEGFFN